jgi:hypothetical protein
MSVRDTVLATQVSDLIENIRDSVPTSRPHNPKVACSNHAPATTKPRTSSRESAAFFVLHAHEEPAPGKNLGTAQAQASLPAGRRC